MRLQRQLEPVAVCLPQLRLQGPLTLGVSDSGSGSVGGGPGRLGESLIRQMTTKHKQRGLGRRRAFATKT